MNRRSFGRLRAAGLMALGLGAVGSIALELQVGSRAPAYLLVVFALWVVSPFAALAWGERLSQHWSEDARAALYAVMFVIAAGTLAVYGYIAFGPSRPQPAFAFVVVPPLSWMLAVILVPLGVFVVRRIR